MKLYRDVFKRILDCIICTLSLLLMSPLLLLVTLLLCIVNRSSGAFFIQERPGRYGQIFKVIKFKTMNDRRDKNGTLLPDKERLTIVGKIVRSLSIDELPQLINVIKGDMSIVGPRPLMVKYIPLYSDFQARRHEVRPGITGWAQVNGRNSISWERKFELDVFYVDNLSFILDLRIICLTVKKVFVREGISQEGQATVETFTGSKQDGH